MENSKILMKTFSHLTICSLFLVSLLFAHGAFSQAAEVKVFAHRGGKLEFDENTIQAFQSSYDKGLRGFETDIRKTKDDHLVVFHDGDFKRIFGRDGSIEAFTLEEVKALRTEHGNQIPTLDEVLEFMNSKPWLYVEFELKTRGSEYTDEMLEDYVDEIYEKIYSNKPPTSDYVITSFDKRPLRYLKGKYPNVDLLFIKNKGLSEELIAEAEEIGVKRIGCRIERTSRDRVKWAKKRCFIICLWPWLSIEDFLLAVQLDRDYICTDVPVEVYKWVKENAPWISLK